jgi:SAM-dependent methyltransferase
MLKTDLFEDAFGDDTMLPSLLSEGTRIIGIDWLPHVVQRAAKRFHDTALVPITADGRALPLRSGAVASVLSPSTLDHFSSREDFDTAIAELSRVLAPGGTLLITLDNPRNPLYWVLRLLGGLGWTPFPMGYTPRPAAFEAQLREAGFDVVAREWLIHNPRLVGTMLFLLVERLLGRRGDRIVSFTLNAFALLGALPTRSLTACFVATCARKRDANDPTVIPP